MIPQRNQVSPSAPSSSQRPHTVREVRSHRLPAEALLDEDAADDIPEEWDGRWWATYGRVCGWKEAKAAYSQEATVLGVLSTLLLTISCGALFVPPVGGNEDRLLPDEFSLRLWTYSSTVAALSSSTCLVGAAIMMLSLNLCVTEGMVKDFLDRYEFLTMLNGFSFGLQTVALVLLAFAALVIDHSNKTDVLVCTVIGAVVFMAYSLLFIRAYQFHSMGQMRRLHIRLVGKLQHAANGEERPSSTGGRGAATAAGEGGKAACDHEAAVQDGVQEGDGKAAPRSQPQL